MRSCSRRSLSRRWSSSRWSLQEDGQLTQEDTWRNRCSLKANVKRTMSAWREAEVSGISCIEKNPDKELEEDDDEDEEHLVAHARGDSAQTVAFLTHPVIFAASATLFSTHTLHHASPWSVQRNLQNLLGNHWQEEGWQSALLCIAGRVLETALQPLPPSFVWRASKNFGHLLDSLDHGGVDILPKSPLWHPLLRRNIHDFDVFFHHLVWDRHVSNLLHFSITWRPVRTFSVCCCGTGVLAICSTTRSRMCRFLMIAC